jgi:hypothetical protein
MSRWLLPQYAVPGLVQRFKMGPSTEERFKASGTLGWEHKTQPGMPIDAMGFLSTHAPERRKAPAEARLLLIGDSLGEALVMDDDVPHWEDFLSRAWRKQVKFWTFSVAGYRINHFSRILRFKGAYIHPDLVLVSFCLLDPYPQAPVVLLQGNKLFMLNDLRFSAMDSVVPALFSHSQLYRFFWLARARGRRSQRDFERADSASFLDILAWCRERHAKLYAVVWPFFIPPGRYPPHIRSGYKTIQEWLTTNHVPFLDLHKAFPPQYWKLYHNQTTPSDDIHPSPEGYRRATQLILEFLAGQNGPC